MELRPKEEAVLNNIDMEPILGSIQDRLQHSMEISVRFMRERNEARAVARLFLAQLSNRPANWYRKKYPWLREKDDDTTQDHSS